MRQASGLNTSDFKSAAWRSVGRPRSKSGCRALMAWLQWARSRSAPQKWEHRRRLNSCSPWSAQQPPRPVHWPRCLRHAIRQRDCFDWGPSCASIVASALEA
eukprot:scaffold766_cov560-Prasinococcus_capsulatus_cf.AAC.7